MSASASLAFKTSKLSHKVFRNVVHLRHLRAASTNFGFEKVSSEEKGQKVKTVFANVASKYDLMNDAMSFGIHRLWKDYFVQRLNLNKDAQVVDVAGGTGDIAFRVLGALRKMPAGNGTVTLVDINEDMIDVGKVRAEEDHSIDQNRLKWVCADAETLPFPDDSFDLYTIAFGLEIVLMSARCWMKRFDHVDPLLKPFYDLYSFQLIPVMGQILAGDYNSYKYLVESIRVFPDQEAFAQMIKEAGFKNVTYENLSFGCWELRNSTSSGIAPLQPQSLFVK
uniref:2-methoxy-6-polyprenyl-1,4-benzoquinol methylase, mitochondrial n=1 Tax=Ditylenchus dipsaci TaxID=166011 RepID=A0A915D7J3_9BILA